MLAAVGAIQAFAVTAQPSSFSFYVADRVLMLAGGAAPAQQAPVERETIEETSSSNEATSKPAAAAPDSSARAARHGR